jgi:SAM-dependent methyltransferase
MAGHPAYADYWKRKQLIASRSVPHFPIARWWETDGLSEVETIFLETVRGAASLLDVGAGDLRVRDKLLRAGYTGEYHTQDIGSERTYTYADLSAVTRSYAAILCLDVLEHLRLEEGLALLNRMIALLAPGGTLVLQTPNARSIPHPLSWDMTHLHVYNAEDLWAYLRCAGLDARGYRVILAPRPRGPLATAREGIQSYVKRKILGGEFAQNLVLIGRKS